MINVKPKILAFILMFTLTITSGLKTNLAEPAKSEASLPITSRSFLTGVTPTLSLNGTLEEIYATAGSAAEVMNLWFANVPWYSTAEHLKKPTTQALLKLIAQSGLTPIFQLNFWTIQNGKVVLQTPPNMDPATTNLGTPEFRQLWLTQAATIAREHHPKYFCIGNEVDTYYWNCSQTDFENYLTLAMETYDQIKAASPETRVLTVFRLDTIDTYNGWHLIEKIDKNKIDLIGFTSYPHMLGYPGEARYPNPADMPPNYYTRITAYAANKPIAFTEIAWTSSQRLRGGSEQEQVEFLHWFLENTRNMPIEILSWLCLHDLRTAEEETDPNAKPNDYAGLKYKNGTEKAVWSYWQKLHATPKTNQETPTAPYIPAFLIALTIAAIAAAALIKKQKQREKK